MTSPRADRIGQNRAATADLFRLLCSRTLGLTYTLYIPWLCTCLPQRHVRSSRAEVGRAMGDRRRSADVGRTMESGRPKVGVACPSVGGSGRSRCPGNSADRAQSNGVVFLQIGPVEQKMPKNVSEDTIVIMYVFH
jgi:hypothetical protein